MSKHNRRHKEEPQKSFFGVEEDLQTNLEEMENPSHSEVVERDSELVVEETDILESRPIEKEVPKTQPTVTKQKLKKKRPGLFSKIGDKGIEHRL